MPDQQFMYKTKKERQNEDMLGLFESKLLNFDSLMEEDEDKKEIRETTAANKKKNNRRSRSFNQDEMLLRF